MNRNTMGRNVTRLSTRVSCVLLAALLVLVATAACGGGEDADATGSDDVSAKVAMILPGPISDADYNAVAYEALGAVEEEVGVETAYSDAVAVADAERVGRDYINRDFDVVIFHGAQFLPAATSLAALFPDVDFVIQSSGELPDLPDNVFNLGRTYLDGFFLLGRLAAGQSENGTIAFLGGLKIPDFIGGANAVYEGAKSINPDIEVLSAFTGDQNDAVKGRNSAEALIGSGADVLIVALNNGLSGAVEAIKDANASGNRVMFTSLHTDKVDLARDNFLVSMEFDYATAYTDIIDGLLAGDEERYRLMEISNGGVFFSETYNIDDDTRAAFEQSVRDVSSGDLVMDEVSLEEVEIP